MRRDAERPPTSAHHDAPKGDGRRDSPPADLTDHETLATGEDRCERYVRRGVREAPPVRGVRASILGVEDDRPSQAERRDGAERDDARHIAGHDDVTGRPEPGAPEEGIPGHAEDA